MWLNTLQYTRQPSERVPTTNPHASYIQGDKHHLHWISCNYSNMTWLLNSNSGMTVASSFKASPSPKPPLNNYSSTFPSTLTIFWELSQNDLGAISWILPCIQHGKINILGHFLISPLPPPLHCKFTEAIWCQMSFFVCMWFSGFLFCLFFYLCISNLWHSAINKPLSNG